MDNEYYGRLQQPEVILTCSHSAEKDIRGERRKRGNHGKV